MYHSHHDAQVQVPNGLFGAFTIDEMPIPQVLLDKGYTTGRQVDEHGAERRRHDRAQPQRQEVPGDRADALKVGEVVEVNYFNEGLMAHPMHLHQPVSWIIAKDGVPLDQPLPGDTINIAPGERYTVLYNADEPGVWAWHCHILNHAEGPTACSGWSPRSSSRPDRHGAAADEATTFSASYG